MAYRFKVVRVVLIVVCFVEIILACAGKFSVVIHSSGVVATLAAVHFGNRAHIVFVALREHIVVAIISIRSGLRESQLSQERSF